MLNEKWTVGGGWDTNILIWTVAQPGQRVGVGRARKEGVKWRCVGGDAAVKVWVMEGVL